MKYICRRYYNDPNDNKCLRDRCPHSKPHEWIIGNNTQHCFNNNKANQNRGIGCECIPLDLEYHMKKIIKEHGEKK
jgi:hypothetical protein